MLTKSNSNVSQNLSEKLCFCGGMLLLLLLLKLSIKLQMPQHPNRMKFIKLCMQPKSSLLIAHYKVHEIIMLIIANYKVHEIIIILYFIIMYNFIGP